MTNIFRKFQYKKELKCIKLKVYLLLEQAQNGNSTHVDADYWTLYIERLDEMSQKKIKGADEFLLFTIEMYTKYIKN